MKMLQHVNKKTEKLCLDQLIKLAFYILGFRHGSRLMASSKFSSEINLRFSFLVGWVDKLSKDYLS